MQALFRRSFPTESSKGGCVHELQVAHACEKWLARIVTLPDRVWRDHDRRRLLVFSATTREEVEAVAFSYLLKECELRGERIVGLNYAACVGVDGSPARRIVAMYPVQFHLRSGGRVSGSKAIENTFTANLSETGIFLVTARGLVEGALLSLALRFPGRPERLEGQVMWSRPEGEEGRPPGVGVELVDPPLSYRARLLNLR